MKILLITDFSYPSICGVWNRVYNDAKYLISKGHDVHVFSSNIVKGGNEKSSKYEEYGGIKIHRFKAIKKGENLLFWKFRKEFFKLNPDIVHAHVYRHPCTHFALKYSKRLNKPCFLTTHAPFVSRKIRGNILSFLASTYDKIFKKELNDFKKIITITKWEEPYLFNLGVKKDKFVFIPNSIPNEFFTEKSWSQREIPKVLFFGRINPIKNIECLIRSVSELDGIKVNIIGPYDEWYYEKLRRLIISYGSSHRINLTGPVFGINEKVKLFNEHDILVLPSFREAMPQVLIEAMASGLVVISSKTDGGKELVKHGENGYLFDINNHPELSILIKNYKNGDIVTKKAREFAKQFKADVLGEKLLIVYNS